MPWNKRKSEYALFTNKKVTSNATMNLVESLILTKDKPGSKLQARLTGDSYPNGGQIT